MVKVARSLRGAGAGKRVCGAGGARKRRPCAVSKPQYQPLQPLAPANTAQLTIQLPGGRLRVPLIVFFDLDLAANLDCMSHAGPPEGLQEEKSHAQPDGGRLNAEEPATCPRRADPASALRPLNHQNEHNRGKGSRRKQAQERKNIHVHEHPAGNSWNFWKGWVAEARREELP